MIIWDMYAKHFVKGYIVLGKVLGLLLSLQKKRKEKRKKKKTDQINAIGQIA